MKPTISRTTLDKLFASAECELAYVYGWGNYRPTMQTVITSDTAIVSTLEGVRAATQTAMDDFMKKIK